MVMMSPMPATSLQRYRHVPSPMTWSYANQPSAWAQPSMMSSYGSWSSPSLPSRTGAGRWAKLDIIHTNDTHEPYNLMPRIVTGFRELKQQSVRQGHDVMPVAAGDWNISSELSGFKLNIKLHNLMGLIGSTFGNHEFDGGTSVIAKTLYEAKFPLFAVNLSLDPSDPLYTHVKSGRLITTSAVYTTPSGERYGLIGVTVPKLSSYMNPKYANEGGRRLDSFSLDDSLVRIQQEVNRLEQVEGVNKIILLSHMGYKNDKKLAKRVSGIDVVVGGHSHTRLEGLKWGETLFMSPRNEPVLIMQTGKDGKAIGYAQLTFDPYGRVIPQSQQLFNPRQFGMDQEAAMLVDAELGPSRTYGRLTRNIDMEAARTEGENGVANFIADAIRDKTGADFGFMRGPDFRKDLYAGPFTKRDIQTLLPFHDPVVKLKVSGTDVRHALEQSALCIKKHKGSPGIIHASGNLRYTVDKATGKLVSALVRDSKSGKWNPLDDKASYTVAIGEFVITNRVEWPMFKAEQVVQRYGELPARRVMYEYIIKAAHQQAAKGKEPVFSFPEDGRLTVLNKHVKSSKKLTPIDIVRAQLAQAQRPEARQPMLNLSV